MRHYHKNPRQITKKEFADLRDSLRKFGDLSGVVHNLNTDEIIGGNQRMEIFDIHNCQIEIVNQLAEPDEQGTVATGWVLWEGKRYTYRAVRWDERQAEEANIRANKTGGGWDFDVLANEFSTDDLLEWGFQGYQLGMPAANDPNQEWQGMPEFDIQNKAFRSLMIHFETQQDLSKFLEAIQQTITENTKYIWFPARKPVKKSDLVYSNES